LRNPQRGSLAIVAVVCELPLSGKHEPIANRCRACPLICHSLIDAECRVVGNCKEIEMGDDAFGYLCIAKLPSAGIVS
jgi:hypothetical protein